MQVLLGAKTVFFCCCIWVSGPGFQDSDRHNGSSCCSSHLGLLLYSCCYYFFFLKTWVSGPQRTCWARLAWNSIFLILLLLLFSWLVPLVVLLTWDCYSSHVDIILFFSGPGFQDLDARRTRPAWTPGLVTERRQRNRAPLQSKTRPRYRAKPGPVTEQNRTLLQSPVDSVTEPIRRKPELREGLSELYSSIDAEISCMSCCI
jgi:hypothetical protein